MPALAEEDDAEDGYCDKRRHRNGESDPRAAVPSPRLGVATEHPDQKLMVFARSATHGSNHMPRSICIQPTDRKDNAGAAVDHPKRFVVALSKQYLPRGYKRSRQL